jgi:hypothetical protein
MPATLRYRMPAALRYKIFSSFFILKKINIRINRNAILPCISYCRGTGFIELGKEQTLRVFLNCVLSNIFGPKGEEEKIAK